MKLKFPDGITLKCSDEVIPKMKVLNMAHEETGGNEFPVHHGTFENWVTMIEFAHTGILRNESKDWWAVKADEFTTLKELALLADYVNYPDFMDRVCRRIAECLPGRSQAEMRAILEMPISP
jgi:hypothetical protein